MKIKNILYLVAISVLIIGLSLLNFKNLNFHENINAYIVILSSLVMFGFLIFLNRNSYNVNTKLMILNIVMGIGILYFILEVLFNISNSSDLARYLKIIPAFATVMFSITSKKHIKKDIEKY